jgi:phosphatidylinositol alpha-1,6-mannosyltransferase
MTRLVPGVDATAFTPGVGRRVVRARYQLGERPVIVCVSRLVPRKGQDMLIRALPGIQRRVSGAALLLVGEGPDSRRLRALASRLGVRPDVFFAGRAPWGELAAHHAAGDVFAMPCRTRHGGFDVEGLGICYLEAAAVGLPVITGDSGGAPDAVLDGRSGFVVGGRDMGALVQRISWLLARPAEAGTMGQIGREWVRTSWQPSDQAQVLVGLLDPQ